MWHQRLLLWKDIKRLLFQLGDLCALIYSFKVNTYNIVDLVCVPCCEDAFAILNLRTKWVISRKGRRGARISWLVFGAILCKARTTWFYLSPYWATSCIKNKIQCDRLSATNSSFDDIVEPKVLKEWEDVKVLSSHC